VKALKLKIAELKEGMKGLEIIGTIARKGNPEQRGGKLYCRCILKDDSAHIVLNLWRDQVNQVKDGDRVRISKGFVHKWKNEIQLSTWSAIETR